MTRELVFGLFQSQLFSKIPSVKPPPKAAWDAKSKLQGLSEHGESCHQVSNLKNIAFIFQFHLVSPRQHSADMSKFTGTGCYLTGAEKTVSPFSKGALTCLGFTRILQGFHRRGQAATTLQLLALRPAPLRMSEGEVERKGSRGPICEAV
jgi:hypothetical protein